MNCKVLFLLESKKFHFHSEGIKSPVSKQKSYIAFKCVLQQKLSFSSKYSVHTRGHILKYPYNSCCCMIIVEGSIDHFYGQVIYKIIQAYTTASAVPEHVKTHQTSDGSKHCCQEKAAEFDLQSSQCLSYTLSFMLLSFY